MNNTSPTTVTGNENKETMADEEHSLEPSSLEYIEDPYFNPHDSTLTPSLDHVEYLDETDLLENELDLFDLRQLEFDDLNCTSLTSFSGNDESVNVEAEFFNAKRANAIIRAFVKKDFKRQVRVTYCDLTKPYLAKLPKENNFRRYLDLNNGNEDAMAAGDSTVIPDQLNMTEEERERHEEYKKELAEIDEEIATLRTVLAAKLRRSAELKRNLGITVWKEVTDDINQGFKNVKDSNVYQTVETKVGQVTKAVTDAPIYQKTTSIIGGITGGITNKLGQMRHSESFKSFEEKATSAFDNVKTKVGSVSRSGSQQSLDDALRSRSGSIATSPTIPEEKPLM